MGSLYHVTPADRAALIVARGFDPAEALRINGGLYSIGPFAGRGFNCFVTESRLHRVFQMFDDGMGGGLGDRVILRVPAHVVAVGPRARGVAQAVGLSYASQPMWLQSGLSTWIAPRRPSVRGSVVLTLPTRSYAVLCLRRWATSSVSIPFRRSTSSLSAPRMGIAQPQELPRANQPLHLTDGSCRRFVTCRSPAPRRHLNAGVRSWLGAKS